jgi:mannose-6-phosphate isomerase-like protein (cupin superfamily)
MAKRFTIARPAELPPAACPCGEARRAFTDDPDGKATLHITDISLEAKKHYHKRLTELYYILEGEGQIELDGERHPIRPGDAVLIKPGCRHRAIGKLRALIVATPAFDPADEWFD